MSQDNNDTEQRDNTDIGHLRILARQRYLSHREEQKLLILKQEILEYNNDIKQYGWLNLTKQEQEDYEYKKQILGIVLQRKDLSEQIYSQLNFNYQLPLDYFTTEDNDGGDSENAQGLKIDRKRKKQLLSGKGGTYKDFDLLQQPNKKIKSDWEKWEQSQVSATNNKYNNNGSGHHLQDNFEDPSSLNLPGSNKYEFVFDDSQNIDFVTDGEKLVLNEEIIDTHFEQQQQQQQEEQQLQEQQQQVLKQRIESEKQRIKIIEETKKSLPVYKYKDQIIAAVEKFQVLIFVGETGSGKTTQLPQYLYEAGFCKNKEQPQKDPANFKKIAITQPRRVAATSVAARVADEMGFKLGNEVGYSIRFDDKTSPKTLIKYVTDGMLLREFLTDPELTSYSAIIIDEAHERTISTDILLGLLKDILKVNKDLKLIISSATVNSKKFSDFFDNAPIFNVPGRRYPVDIYYTQQPEANYLSATITTIFQIHLSQPTPGDILVFLTGQEEIELVEENLKETCMKLGNSLAKELIVTPIYSNLPIELQSRIFEPTPANARKVVLATNIAETSITIDGIKYVIDPGFVKEKVFNPTTGMESLVVTPCSQASAQQRAGRAGRVGPGKCFRLYTKWSFKNELPKQPTPEILRTNLSSVILLLLSLGIYDVVRFEFLDRPSSEVLIKSLELLYSLGALNDRGELTKVGRTMADFPIDPMFSKTLITSVSGRRKNNNGDNNAGIADGSKDIEGGHTSTCLEEILTIIAMLSESSSLFYRPKHQKEQADKCKENFAKQSNKGQGQSQGLSDHFLYLEIWQQWVASGYSYQWCRDNFLQYKTLNRARNVREQLERLCQRVDYFVEAMSSSQKKTIENHGNNDDSDGDDDEGLSYEKLTNDIKRAIAAGFFPHTARLTKSGTSYRNIKRQQEVFIHPSSVLFKQKPPAKLVLYNELVLTTKEYMRNVLVVDEAILKEVAPHYFTEDELKEMETGKNKKRMPK